MHPTGTPWGAQAPPGDVCGLRAEWEAVLGKQTLPISFAFLACARVSRASFVVATGSSQGTGGPPVPEDLLSGQQRPLVGSAGSQPAPALETPRTGWYSVSHCVRLSWAICTFHKLEKHSGVLPP